MIVTKDEESEEKEEDFSHGKKKKEAVKEEKCQNHEPAAALAEVNSKPLPTSTTTKGRPSFLIGTFNESSTDYKQIVKKLN